MKPKKKVAPAFEQFGSFWEYDDDGEIVSVETGERIPGALIAAAPGLLMLVKKALKDLPPDQSYNQDRKEYRAAIKKAVAK